MSTPPDYFDPNFDPNSKLANRWSQPLSASAALPTTTLTPEEAERHGVYSLLLMTSASVATLMAITSARSRQEPSITSSTRSVSHR